MRIATLLALHVVAVFGLVAAAVSLATWRGQLWPFDPGFSALVTGGGLLLLLLAWGPVWFAPLILSALLKRHWQRLVLWPVAVFAMVALHAVFGTTRGFAPLGSLGISGALLLYAVPVALTVIFGSALRETFRHKPLRTTNEQRRPEAARQSS